METEPQSSQRDQGVSQTKSRQCPNCGSYHVRSKVTYIHPHTGQFVTVNSLYGVIIPIVVFVVVFYVINGPNPTQDYVTAMNTACVAIFIAIAGAAIAYLLYRSWALHRLRTYTITRAHYVCRYCGKEWDVVREPVKKLL